MLTSDASQETSDIPLGNSDLDVASFTELPKKCPHKRVVKTGVSLFLPADFLKDDRLVPAIKRINITPAELLTIVSVLITIGVKNLNSINLSHTYIRKHFNKITNAVFSTVRRKWAALEKRSGAL